EAETGIWIVLNDRDAVSRRQFSDPLAFLGGDTHTEWVMKVGNDDCQMWMWRLRENSFERISIHTSCQIGWYGTDIGPTSNCHLLNTREGNFFDYRRCAGIE